MATGLDRDSPVQASVAAPIDLSIPSGADEVDELVRDRACRLASGSCGSDRRIIAAGRDPSAMCLDRALEIDDVLPLLPVSASLVPDRGSSGSSSRSASRAPSSTTWSRELREVGLTIPNCQRSCDSHWRICSARSGSHTSFLLGPFYDRRAARPVIVRSSQKRNHTSWPYRDAPAQNNVLASNESWRVVRWCALAALTLLPVSVLAQVPATLTLGDALTRALDGNPSVLAARSARAIDLPACSAAGQRPGILQSVSKPSAKRRTGRSEEACRSRGVRQAAAPDRRRAGDREHDRGRDGASDGRGPQRRASRLLFGGGRVATVRSGAGARRDSIRDLARLPVGLHDPARAMPPFAGTG